MGEEVAREGMNVREEMVAKKEATMEEMDVTELLP